MAEQSSHDVVNKAQSEDFQSTDVPATQTIEPAARAELEKALPTSLPDLSASEQSTQPLFNKAEPKDENLRPIPRSEALNDKFNTDVDGPVLDPASSDLLPTVNGLLYNNEHTGDGIPEEGSAGLEGSAASDTDSSKADLLDATAKDPGDGIDLNRPYTVKKSASFKPVSVTRNFLAKAGAAATPLLKTAADKANAAAGLLSSSAAMAPRPRLVAKSASGLRASTPKPLAIGSKAGKAGGPDPNQVWNRNRATPQATPKRLTDEELRQQYGIQLDSRPQDDGDGKEAKWADIDDDEDDWAPETIEWNDGTKIDLSKVDDSAVLAEQAAAAEAKEKEAEAAAQKLLAVKATTTVGPNATVLRLGTAAQPKVSGLISKGSSDRPTLVSKPSSNSVKSPWASLLPVDKASPVPINPLTQSSRFAQKDVHGFEGMPAQPLHAKEIAADDFSRFLRDTQSGTPRELFNSQSGRYEPVNETRRGSVRKDPGFRAPSLLQRPMQGDQHGPAEPSAAFQARSAHQESGSWGRRRTSSNVSGDSGKFLRRASMNKGALGDIHQRRDSQYEQSPLTPGIHSVQSQDQSAVSQSPTVSQHLSVGGSITDSPIQAHVHPAISSVPITGVENAVAVQKKLMKEKREAAIKRKQEEEAKEEAAKKERIRLKMEALGMTDEKMGKKETAERALPSPIVILKDVKEPLVATLKSPVKPPVPKVTGQPQQYGMMKVHAPQPVNGVVPSTAPAEKRPSDAPTTTTRSEQLVSSKSPTQTPYTNGIVIQKPTELFASKSPELRQQDMACEPRPQWVEVQQQPAVYPTWHNNGMTTHSSPGANLWGSPSNHRALGNGDFQQNVQRPQMRQNQFPQHVLSPPPQPIGPPKLNQHIRGNQLSRSTAEESQTIPAFPPTEQMSLPLHNQTRASQMSTPHNQIRSEAGAPTLTNTRTPLVEPPKTGLAAWANISTTLAKLDAERLEVSKREHAARLAEEKRTGISQAPKLPPMTETWRQVKRGEEAGQRHVVNVTKTQLDSKTLASEIMPREVQKPSSQGPITPQVRSRFQDIFEQTKHSVSLTSGFSRSTSPTPPPPDSEDHPAYMGIHHRPMVKLPGSEPVSEGPIVADKPIVRLPPSAATSSPRSAPDLSTTVTNSLRPAPQSLVNNSSWQDRFNGLFERKAALERKFGDVVDFSSSKVPLELAAVDHSAAVTLPPLDEMELAKLDQPIKNVEDEDALFEERDFGSVPTVRIPAQAPVKAWNPVPKTGYKARFMVLTETDVASVVAFSPSTSEAQRANGFLITVRLMGMAAAKVKTMPRSGGTPTSRAHHPNSPRGKPRHGQKSRDHPTTHPTPKAAPNVPRPSMQTGSGQQSRSKTGTGHASWARRVSGVAQ